MSCKIIFIRHGQSLGNLNDMFLGHTDLDLSPLGYSQAKCTANYLKDIHIDKVYSSDLIRAYNTCRAYLEVSNKTAERTERLREIFVGLWEGKNFETLKTVFKNSYSIWLNDIGHAKPDGGETVVELQKRAVDFITEIAKENDSKTVAVFTHATIIRAFFTFAYGKDISYMKDLKWATNASVSSVEYSNGKFKVLEYSTDNFLNKLKTDVTTNV